MLLQDTTEAAAGIVYYTIEIISDRGEDEAVEITYSDGYTGRFYCSKAYQETASE